MVEDYLVRESNRINQHLEVLLANAKQRLTDIEISLDTLNEEYKKARADGDLRENAAYEDAVSKMQEAQGDKQRWEILSDSIQNVKARMKHYVHQDKIGLFSTVHLVNISGKGRNVIEDIEDEFIFKIFPYGITDVENGILSIESTVGKKLLDKQVGEVVKMRDRSSGHYANFQIKGFY